MKKRYRNDKNLIEREGSFIPWGVRGKKRNFIIYQTFPFIERVSNIVIQILALNYKFFLLIVSKVIVSKVWCCKF